MSARREVLEKRIAQAKEEEARLRELRAFFAIGNSPANRRRMEEINQRLDRLDEEIKQLEGEVTRLA